MSIKARLFRFTRTASCHDLRSSAIQQALRTISTKARRFEVLHHTAGSLSTFA